MGRRMCTILFLPALLLSAVVTDCAAVTIPQTTRQQTSPDVPADVLTTGALSEMTQQVLRIHALHAVAEDPARAFQALEGRKGRAPDDDQQVALAELALWHAMRTESSDPTGAADWYMLAAARSYDFLFTKAPEKPFFDLHYKQMGAFYLRALAGFLQQLKRTTSALAVHQRTIFDQPYLVDVASGAWVVDPTTFDELLFADEMHFEGLANRHRRFGFGLPLVGFRQNTHPHPADHFSPNVGTTQAVTVLWRFEPAAPGAQTARVARLYFYDAMQVDAIDLNGVQVPLAADFTAPWGLLMSRTVFTSIGLSQTFASENGLDEAGLYMTEPFDPHKIPLIMVYGLLSSPVPWINLHNDLLGDPVVRQHYQLWHFVYPPRLPILVSAALFREKLEELYTFFDPQAQLPALQNTVIIAHSMGGLLTKTVVADSGEQLWERLFPQLPADLSLSGPLRKQLDRILRFHRAPFITRVIFLAVPHRGSLLAESVAGRMGRLWITVPAAVLTPLRLLREQAGTAIAPNVLAALEEDPTSSKGLSPQHPIIQALAGVAIDKGVPFHSIIGDRGLGDGEQSSDGVVPYTNAHLDGAASELIVPADHAATAHPLTVREIKRIVRLHLQHATPSRP